MAEPAAATQMTADALFELPDDDNRYELAGGALLREPPAGAGHGAVSLRIGRLLDEFAEARGLGVVCGADTGFILQRNPDTVRAPDAAFVAQERVPVAGPPDKYWPFAPDLAVEVVSPSDRREDVQAKVAEYLGAGTRLVWVVDPQIRRISVYRSAHDLRVLGEGDELSGEDVLPGLRCPVRRCFSPR